LRRTGKREEGRKEPADSYILFLEEGGEKGGREGGPYHLSISWLEGREGKKEGESEVPS